MNYIAKLGLFTLLFIVLNWFISQDMFCALQLNPSCMFSFFSKYIVFMIAMVLYDKYKTKKNIQKQK